MAQAQEFENQGAILAAETRSHYRKVFKPAVSNAGNARMPPRHNGPYNNDKEFGSYNEATPKGVERGFGQSQIPTGTSSSINSQYSGKSLKCSRKLIEV